MVKKDDSCNLLQHTTSYMAKKFLNGGSISEYERIDPSENFEDEQENSNSGNAETFIGASGVISTAFDHFDKLSAHIERTKNIYSKRNVLIELSESELNQNIIDNEYEIISDIENDIKFYEEEFISDREDKTKLSYMEIAKLFEEENNFLCIDKMLNIYDRKYGLFVPLDKNSSDALIRRQSPEEIKNRLNKNTISEIVLWLHSKTHWRKIDGEKLKQINSNYVNFQNCTLKLPSLEIYEHSPSFYCTNVLSVDYSDEYCDDYKSSFFFKAINDSLGDSKRKIDLLQEIFAVAIAGIPLKHFYYFYGVPDSGKSKIVDILRCIVGEEYTSAIPLKNLDARFGLGLLDRKRLNVAGESNVITREGMEITKRITGGDYTLGEKKYENASEFYPQAALIFMSNHKLKIIDGQADLGFLNRMTVLEFSSSIPIEKQDAQLSLKLKSPDEINAIISWALQGVDRLYRNNFQLTHVANSEDYILSNSSTNLKSEQEILLARFRDYLNETFDIDSKSKEYYISVPDIFANFRTYMGLRETDDFEHKDNLCLHGILQDEYHLKKKRVKPPGQKTQQYGYYGLIPKEEMEGVAQ